MKLYVITMPDGSRWGIPPEVIAEDRAKFYADDPDATYQDEFDLMMNWFDSADYEFQDWAKDNMNWSDVKDSAIQLPRSRMEVDYEGGWMNGDVEYPVDVKVEERSGDE